MLAPGNWRPGVAARSPPEGSAGRCGEGGHHEAGKAGEKHASTAADAEAIKALGLGNRFVVQTTDRAQRFNDEDLSSTASSCS